MLRWPLKQGTVWYKLLAALAFPWYNLFRNYLIECAQALLKGKPPPQGVCIGGEPQDAKPDRKQAKIELFTDVNQVRNGYLVWMHLVSLPPVSLPAWFCLICSTNSFELLVLL